MPPLKCQHDVERAKIKESLIKENTINYTNIYSGETRYSANPQKEHIDLSRSLTNNY